MFSIVLPLGICVYFVVVVVIVDDHFKCLDLLYLTILFDAVMRIILLLNLY